MTTNQAAAANLETFRETDGRFGSQPHTEAPLTLEDDLLAKRDTIHEYIKFHTVAVADAHRSVYESTMTLNAFCLAAEGINVGHVYFGGDKLNWWVNRATDINGFELDDESVEIINETLHDSGAGYNPAYSGTGLDLGELAKWTPPVEPVPGQESLSDRAQARMEKALDAATPAGDLDTRANDLLTDMRHWAARNGVDINEVWQRSSEHYDEEI